MRTLPLVLALVVAGGAHARPSGPLAFCDVYPDSATCAGRMPTCKLCHTSTGDAPDWNPYGLAIINELAVLGHDFVT